MGLERRKSSRISIGIEHGRHRLLQQHHACLVQGCLHRLCLIETPAPVGIHLKLHRLLLLLGLLLQGLGHGIQQRSIVIAAISTAKFELDACCR